MEADGRVIAAVVVVVVVDGDVWIRLAPLAFFRSANRRDISARPRLREYIVAEHEAVEIVPEVHEVGGGTGGAEDVDGELVRVLGQVVIEPWLDVAAVEIRTVVGGAHLVLVPEHVEEKHGAEAEEDTQHDDVLGEERRHVLCPAAEHEQKERATRRGYATHERGQIDAATGLMRPLPHGLSGLVPFHTPCNT
jgi:hypothetical protein